MGESQDKKNQHLDLKGGMEEAFHNFLTYIEDQNEGKDITNYTEEFQKYFDERYGSAFSIEKTMSEIAGLLGRPVDFDDLQKVQLSTEGMLSPEYRAQRVQYVDNTTKRGLYRATVEHMELDGFKEFIRRKTDLPFFDEGAKKRQRKGEQYTAVPAFDESVFDELLAAYDRASLTSGEDNVSTSVREHDTMGPTVEAVSEAIERIGGVGEKRMKNDLVHLIDVQKNIFKYEIAVNYEKKRFQQREYFYTQSTGVNEYLSATYPRKEYITQGGHEHDEKVQYYTWVASQADKRKNNNDALLARTLIHALQGEQTAVEEELPEIKKAVMQQMVDEKMKMGESIQLFTKLQQLCKARGLRNKSAQKIVDAYRNFWRSLFDVDVTRHTLPTLDGSGYVLDIKKSLTFHPEQMQSAESINNLFSLSLSYSPGLDDGTLELMTLLNHNNILLPHTPMTLWENGKPGREMLLVESQLYTIRTKQGIEVDTGHISIEAAGDDDGNEPLWQVIVTNPTTGVRSFPFGDQAVEDPATILKNYCYEPVGGISFNQEFALGGSENSGFKEHAALLDKTALTLMVQDKWKPEGEYIMNKAIRETLGIDKKELKSFLQTKIVSEKEIPASLFESTQADQIHAWIHEGKIYINATYFAKAHGLSHAALQGFIDEEGYLDGNRVTQWVYELGISAEEKQKRQRIYADFKRRTAHEKAHRVFDYYVLQDGLNGEAPVTVTSLSGEQIPVSNELLSKISEVASLFSTDPLIVSLTDAQRNSLDHLLDFANDQQGGLIVSLPVIRNGKKTMHEVSLATVEEMIQQTIPGFTFARLEEIDTALVIDELKNAKGTRSFDSLTQASSEVFETKLKRALKRDEIEDDKNTLYIYEGFEHGGAGIYRSLPNALPIRLGERAGSGYKNNDLDINNKRPLIQADIDKIKAWIQAKVDAGEDYKVVLPVQGNGNSALGEDGDILYNDESNDVVDFMNEQLATIDPLLADPVGVTNRRRQQDETPLDDGAPFDERPDSEDFRDMDASNMTVEQNKQAFNEELRDFGGDNSIIEPYPGMVLFLKDGLSNRPGKNSDWLKVTVREVTDHTIVVQVTGHTERELGSAAGMVEHISRDKQGARQLKKGGKGKINRFKQLHGKKEFLSYQKGVSMPSQWADIGDDGIKSYVDNNKQHKGPITHIAIPLNDSAGETISQIYKVNRGSEGVTIQAETKDGLSRAHNLDYTSFIQFISDKGLQPYTQVEIDRWGDYETPKPEDTGHPKLSFIDRLYSIQSIIASGKNILETFKTKFTQNDEIDVVQLENWFLGMIPKGIDGGFLYLDDVVNDAKTKKDAMIFKNIEKFKEMLSRSDIGDGTHGKAASNQIKKEVFEKGGKSRYFRYKAAGYLLYALDQGHPYFRELSEYNGTGHWVKALLGPEYQQMYLNQKKLKIDKLKSAGVPDDDLQDEIAKFELHFIKDKTTDHPLFGTRFGRKVEDAKDAWAGGKEKVSKAKGGAEKKGNVRDINDMVKNGGIKNMSPGTYLGGLEGLEGYVESGQHYKIFYKLIIMGMVTGFTKTFSKEYMDMFTGICRRRGIPIGMYITDPDSSAKVTKVLDYIADRAGASESLTDAIRKKMPGKKWDPKSLTADNFTYNKQHVNVMKGFEGWWETYGDIAMGAFNYQEDYLIEGLVDEKLKKKENKEMNDAVTGYFSDSVVFNSYRDYRDTSGGKMPPGDSPFFNGVLNLAPGTFQSYMFSLSGGRFRHDQSQDMREKFGASMHNFGALMEGRGIDHKEPFMMFIMKKFQLYFAPKVGSKGMKMMKYYMMQGVNSTDPEWQNKSDEQRAELLLKKMNLIASKYIYGDNSLKEVENKKLGIVELVNAKNNNSDNQYFQSERMGEQSLKDGTDAIMRVIANNIYDFPESATSLMGPTRGGLIGKTWG